MATISVKLKAKANCKTKESIYNAHLIFNHNVRLFEEFLLLARGKDYYYSDVDGKEQYKSREEATKELQEYLKKRGIKNISACTEALSGLEAVIRSKGSQAAGMLKKLYNADSDAGMKNLNKIISPEPEWVSHYDLAKDCFESTEYQAMANSWIESAEGREAIAPIIDGSGRPSSFKLAYTQGKEWYAKFVKDQNKYKEDLKDGLLKILFVLNQEEAFPLIDLNEQLVLSHPVWVRLMLKTALENFNSYLACDENTRTDYQKIVEEFESAKLVVQEKYQAEFELLEVFLKENYIQTDRSPYLTPRMCRGIEKLRFAWASCHDYSDRMKVIDDWQANSIEKKNIGDVNFFHWLAFDEHVHILKGDCIETFEKYYSQLRLKEQKRKCASYTVADPINSKRYLFFEGENGTNYKRYKFNLVDNHIKIEVPILLQNESHDYYEETIDFELAHNSQMQNIVLHGSGGITFENNKTILHKGSQIYEKENFSGKLGGADLRVETTDSGQQMGIYMSFTITVDEKCSDDWKK